MLEIISIIGGGTWGLSLGRYYHRLGWLRALYTSYNDTYNSIRYQGATSRLEGIDFPPDFPITQNIREPLQASNILIASTLKALSGHLQRLAPYYLGQNVLLCCKGQDHETFALPHEIAAQYLPEEKIFLLSGPSFAADLAEERVVAVCLAGKNIAQTIELAQHLNTTHLRLYATDDRIGVALGGAYKNVLAIAAGIGYGLKIGASAEAALVTRGLVELRALCVSLGGAKLTVLGLSGLGDLILTCGNTQSRNFCLGAALGQGQKIADALAQLGAVAEGYSTAKSLPQLISRPNLELPICQTVYHVLYESLAPDTALNNLINRPGGKIE